MKRAFTIPRQPGEALPDYFERVTARPIIFDEGAARVIDADGSGHVEVEGLIPDAAEAALREP